MKRYLYPLLILPLFFACAENPIACFESDKNSLTLGETIVFTDCSTNTDYSYIDFGDGSDSVSFDGTISYTYHKAGIYNVTLYSFDAYGYNTVDKDIVVNTPTKSDIQGKWQLTKEYDWKNDKPYLIPSPVTFDLLANNVYYKIKDYGTLYADTILSDENPDKILFNWAYSANDVQLNISLEDLYFVVKNNDKKRFDLTDDLLKIRANQGHSIEVDLDLPNIEPTEYLYHGTATRFLDVIQNEGLKSMERHDVHLSFSKEVAISVGERHGKPVVLKIKAREMFNAGFKFNCTKNNVWLTETVPSMFFEVLEIFNKEKQVLGSKIK